MIVCGVFFENKFSGHILSAQDTEGIKNQVFSIFCSAPAELLRKSSVVQLCNLKDDGTCAPVFLNEGSPRIEILVAELVRDKARDLYDLAAASMEKEEVNA